MAFLEDVAFLLLEHWKDVIARKECRKECRLVDPKLQKLQAQAGV